MVGVVKQSIFSFQGAQPEGEMAVRRARHVEALTETRAHIAAARAHFAHLHDGIFDHPGVTVHIEDGRQHLMRARAPYDLIQIELTSVSTYMNRDILVGRDASALTGSVSVDLGYPTAAVLLPSNLVDTTELETFTQEIRLASSNSGPFQWLIGA